MYQNIKCTRLLIKIIHSTSYKNALREEKQTTLKTIVAYGQGANVLSFRSCKLSGVPVIFSRSSSWDSQSETAWKKFTQSASYNPVFCLLDNNLKIHSSKLLSKVITILADPGEKKLYLYKEMEQDRRNYLPKKLD